MKIKAWIKAFRLRTLPLALAIIIAGTAISIVASPINVLYDTPEGRVCLEEVEFTMPSLTIFLLTLITTLFLQILSNLANDYGDFLKGTDNQNRVGPARALQSGGITKKEMFNGILFFALLSFASGIFLLFHVFGTEKMQTLLIFIGIGVFCIIAAITYTVGKSAYGYHALGDLGVLVFFGGVGITGTSYLQTSIIDKVTFFTALTYGLWATGVLNLNNMRDVDNDIVHGKKTMAWQLGFRGGKIYQLLLMLIPYLFQYFAVYDYNQSPKAFISLSLLPLSLFMAIKIMKVQQRQEFDKFLKFQALLTLANSIVLFSCIYLLHA